MNIGNVQLNGKLIMAPMAGITDLVFRRICRQMGAALVVTEMVSAKAIYFGNQRTNALLATDDVDSPASVQIFGSDPAIMGEIAGRLDSSKFSIIDINMGCPAPKIVRNGDGSALMRNPRLIGEIVSAVKAATTKPVTAKIRLGYDFENRNYLEVARVVEAAGADAITVHGRTRPQMYSGFADWNAIAAVKATVSIPVIGNGDIASPQDAKKRLDESGVDALMIGRAACGNPWIFRRCNHYLATGEILPEPSAQERVELAQQHAAALMELKGKHNGLLEMRKHLAWYIKGIKGATEARVRINAATDYSEICLILSELLENI